MEVMMRAGFLSLGVLSMVALGGLQAECGCVGQPESSPKTYITPGQLDFLDSKIFVKVGEDIFQVPAVFTDETGLYFETASQYRTCSFWEIVCEVCDRCKPKWKIVCPYCHNEPE